jgi:hypothetical protein
MIHGTPPAPEPDIGAAHPNQRIINYLHREPIKFGALVGGVDGRYIEIAPNGNVVTSGDIVHQSQRSQIGRTNLTRFSSNPFYQIRPGRLTFEVKTGSNIVVVRLQSGILQNGVNLSNVSLTMGPASVGVEHIRNHPVTNEMKFRLVNRVHCRKFSFRCKSNKRKPFAGTVDVVFGGRLTIDKTVSGNIDAPLQAEIRLIDNHNT